MRRPALVTLLVLAAAGLVVGLYFAFRPSSESEPGAQTTAPEVVPGTTGAPTQELDVTLRDAKPAGGVQHLTVKQGDQVRVRVESDVSDEIHLHGYDLMREVEAGGEAEIEFAATIPGRFEIELESRGTPIAELEVRP